MSFGENKLATLTSAILRLNTHAEVRSFIKSNQIENTYFERKERLEEADKTARTFASFANLNGGIIAYGVANNTDVVGMPVEQGNELATEISRKIRSLSPPIQSNNYDVFKSVIFSNNRKGVYFVKIKPSLSIHKPHMCSNGSIPLRGNGETQYPKSGDELRSLFFPAPFNPWHIEQIESELNSLKKIRTNQSGLSIILHGSLLSYLDTLHRECISKGNPPEQIAQFALCLQKFREIDHKIREILAAPYRANASEGVTPEAELERELSSLIDNSFDMYRSIFQ